MNVDTVKKFLAQKQFPFLSKAPDVQLLGNGAYNTTFVIDNDFVFRANTHRDSVGGHGLRSEHDILQVLPAGIAPKPYHLDDSCADFPVPYRIESFASGRVITDFTPHVLRMLAQHLIKVHSHKSRKSGPYPGIRASYSIGSTLQQFIAETGDLPDFKEIVAKAQEYVVYWDNEMPLQEFSLVHYDLNSDNMLLDGDTLTLVDWEYSEFGDPAVDFAVLFWFSYLFGYTPRIPAKHRMLFYKEYVAAGGDAGVMDRASIQEPLVVLLQTLWFAAQIKNKDSIPSHILTTERLEIYKQGLQKGLVYLKEHGFKNHRN